MLRAGAAIEQALLAKFKEGPRRQPLRGLGHDISYVDGRRAAPIMILRVSHWARTHRIM
jgi:hypothetical protein